MKRREKPSERCQRIHGARLGTPLTVDTMAAESDGAGAGMDITLPTGRADHRLRSRHGNRVADVARVQDDSACKANAWDAGAPDAAGSVAATRASATAREAL
eukprot:6395085-Prymnesium_polylepis.3